MMCSNDYNVNKKILADGVVVGVCRWCGSRFVKPSNKSSYCCENCRKESRKQQSRKKSHKYYHNHKNDMSEKQRYGLGSGHLGKHRNTCFEKEFKIVQAELVRLKIKK